MTLQRSMPVLCVRDVLHSVAFYERLGFGCHGTWGEPPGFAIVQRDGVTLALDRLEGDLAIPLNQWWAAYVYVTDVAALHAEFTAAGIEGMDALRDPQPYGCRDFDVTDPDGHKIAFGQALNPSAKGPGLRDD